MSNKKVVTNNIRSQKGTFKNLTAENISGGNIISNNAMLDTIVMNPVSIGILA